MSFDWSASGWVAVTVQELPTADLIFIDGNHDYDDVRADIRNYFPLLSPKCAAALSVALDCILSRALCAYVGVWRAQTHAYA
eukprot:3941093-Rhodomonas_salina.1